MALPAGWYPVNGDPAGTQRYWDGEAFTTGPKVDINARRRTNFRKPNSAAKWRMANPLARGAAVLIDYGAPLLVAVGIANAMGSEIPEATVDAWFDQPRLIAAIVTLFLINEVVLVGLLGMSLGKLLLGLRVVSATDRDRPPGLLRALLRTVLQIPLMVFSVVLFALGRRRGLHDLVAGTAVIYA